MSEKTRTRILELVGLVVALAMFAVMTNLGIRLPFNASRIDGNKPIAADEATGWSEEAAPNYFLVTGGADIEEETLGMDKGTYRIMKDESGRPDLVIACVDAPMREAGAERKRDRLPDPLGWPKNKEVEIEFANGTTYHGWLFNRSHLLAKSLGGPDTKENLVTGTRTQNVGDNDENGGMGHTESEARAWLDQHPDGYVLYEVDPVYEGDEVIPRTVEVDIRTSDGSIDEHVVTYNVAKGYVIDYATGEWRKENGSFAMKLTSATTQGEDEPTKSAKSD